MFRGHGTDRNEAGRFFQSSIWTSSISSATGSGAWTVVHRQASSGAAPFATCLPAPHGGLSKLTEKAHDRQPPLQVSSS
jgi:hypothetical protein